MPTTSAKRKPKLKSDFALVCDTELFAPEPSHALRWPARPGLHRNRSLGAKTDLHSGIYGGAAPNPFFALIEIISKLKDSKGKILIPGFYRKVKAPSRTN